MTSAIEMEDAMKKTIGALVGLALLALPVGAAEGGAARDARGFLYGTVEAESGNSYTGFLRWGGEEGFWDDHFNAGKTDLEWADERPDSERRRRSIRILGVTISIDRKESLTRQFIARFGDIAEIEPRRWGATRVTMKNGVVFDVSDSSNDVGATITVEDAVLGTVDIDWDRIERVRFAAAPSGAEPPAGRLYGVLTTEDTTFTGFIQWDLDECLTSDELDGETEDGDLSIEFGRIRAIEKRNSDGAWVELVDGRRLLLEGTNDVDSSTSGIFVEDPRFGRVQVEWDEFERVDFEPAPSSGPGYADYAAAPALSGRVTTGKRTISGRIVFDLDEEYGWEFLNGSLAGVAYNIPFARIRAIEPLGRDRARVVLAGGAELVLEDGQDVSDDNDGLVVIEPDGAGVYVAWRDVERLELD
jgi:hypothetical protein